MTPNESLAAWRRTKGLTQTQVAKLVDVKPSTISRLEKGISKPTLGLAARLARATKGAVSVVSWTEPDPGSAAE